MSLLSDAEKAELSAALTSGTSTWLRPLTVYQEAERVVISDDPNWNPIEGYSQNNTSVQNVGSWTTISGRILWDKTQDWPFMRPEAVAAMLKVKDQTKQAVRVKTDASGYSLLQTAKQVQIDGIACVPSTNPRPHGLFSVDQYTLYFERAA